MNDKETITPFERGILEAAADYLERHRETARAVHLRAIAKRSAAATVAPLAAAPFQDRVQPWLIECFGPMIAGDREERNHRFFEEAIELVQACGMTVGEAYQLVDYTFGRPVGEPEQEVGGVMVTLAALCLANSLDMHANGESELARISVPETVAKIRAKQAAKPKHSPLPQAPVADAARAEPSETQTAPENPYTGFREAQFWRAGFEGRELGGFTGDMPIKVWHEGADARKALAASAQQPARASEAGEVHFDDKAVDAFAAALKGKLADAREKGRKGWQHVAPGSLSQMLREHVEKGDPRDVANFCMFLWYQAASIAPAARQAVTLMDDARDAARWRMAVKGRWLHKRAPDEIDAALQSHSHSEGEAS